MSSSEPLEDGLKELLADVRTLRKALEAESAGHVNKSAFRGQGRACALKWSGNLARRAKAVPGIAAEAVAFYDKEFRRLLTLSSGLNRRSSYITVLDSIARRFRKDLINPSIGVEGGASPSAWDEFLDRIPSSTESNYFREAIDCARAGFLRAATVLGWCACVDHVQRKVALLGLNRFSQASVEMAAQTIGRFKRFNKKFSVSSISELRASVFDDDLLLVTEHLGLIEVPRCLTWVTFRVRAYPR